MNNTLNKDVNLTRMMQEICEVFKAKGWKISNDMGRYIISYKDWALIVEITLARNTKLESISASIESKDLVNKNSFSDDTLFDRNVRDACDEIKQLVREHVNEFLDDNKKDNFEAAVERFKITMLK